MEQGASTVCRAWVLRRKDGVVLGFTDHDEMLIIDGVQCAPSSGLNAGALVRSTGLSVDSFGASGALSHEGIGDEDIKAGRWDTARVDIWLVNWADPETRELTFRGSLGEINWGNGRFEADLRGLAEDLNVPSGRVLQARCDAILGDARCGVAMGPAFVAEAEILTVDDDVILTIESLERYVPRWFERGRLLVLSGEAAGLQERVKVDRVREGGRLIELWTSLRAPLVPGDRVRLEAGCDKLRSTCATKFGNLLNFRGFADIPGDDWLTAYPVQNGRNDGGRR
jgi:uncharacterized phage protein (TIGR02218 family)